MTLRRFLALLLSVLLTLSALPALGEATAAPEAAPAEPPVNPFINMTITDMNGEPFDVSVFDGKPFMLNIWASWCPPCLAELPDLSELAVEYADRISIVGLLTDAMRFDSEGKVQLQQEEIDAVKAIYEEKGISYPSLIPNELMVALMQYLGVQSIPTTVFVAGNGALVDLQVGSRSKADWITVIDAALAKMEAIGDE